MQPRETAVEQFRARLREEYARRFPASAALGARREKVLLDQTSHAVRWNEPFMPTIRKAEGAIVEDLDGHRIVDYWQGHFANILGHNPPRIRKALERALAEGRGLHTGMIHEAEYRLAELVTKRTGTETIRFTTSGTLGTFYASVLAKAFTGRNRVLKVAGGWHGSQPYGLKGVVGDDDGFEHMESEGLAASMPSEIVLTRFNDLDDLRGVFAREGDRIACFLLEPVLGAAGGFVADPEYLREARRLTENHGALLVCDEIITGFRFHAGDLSSAYGVRPDLLVLGKVLGGGMPVAAVAGRRDVLDLCSEKTHRVKFEGGTYSAHALSIVAALEIVRFLVDNEGTVYARLAEAGNRARRELAEVADEAGLPVQFTAVPDGALPGSSLVLLHPLAPGTEPATCPERLAERRHPALSGALLKSVLLLYDVSTRNGLGALSTAHEPRDLERTVEGYRAALRRIRDAGLI